MKTLQSGDVVISLFYIVFYQGNDQNKWLTSLPLVESLYGSFMGG